VPLYVGQQQFGFALLETGPKKGTLYTELWQLISNALQVVFLMKERLELALERERVALLANFIRDVGHEFKTPLSIIAGAHQLFGGGRRPGAGNDRFAAGGVRSAAAAGAVVHGNILSMLECRGVINQIKSEKSKDRCFLPVLRACSQKSNARKRRACYNQHRCLGCVPLTPNAKEKDHEQGHGQQEVR
jgi:signal transduction histidine kinase